MRDDELPVSIVILTKNNEKQLQSLLPALSWCSDIIIVDDDSTDNTKMIAEKYGTRVYHHTLANDFAAQRNFGLQEAKFNWVFFLDSDEIITDELQNEIKKSISHGDYNGYYVKRNDYFLEKLLQYGETSHVRLLRLGKKNKGKWKGKVHEVWEIEGPIGTLDYPLQHYPHPTLQEFISDINTYSTIAAKERAATHTVSVWQIIVYPGGKFIQNYVFRQGFRDGVQGTIMAMLMSMHSFLVRGKMYIMQQNGI